MKEYIRQSLVIVSGVMAGFVVALFIMILGGMSFDIASGYLGNLKGDLVYESSFGGPGLNDD